MDTTEPKKKTTRAPRAKKEKEATVPASAEAESVTVQVVAEESPVPAGGRISGLGRRKTAVASVKLVTSGTGKQHVNGKPLDAYFTTYALRNTARGPLEAVGQETALDLIASVSGGGVSGQASSVRLGIARALIKLNPTYRKTLKKMGYLTRDPRSKERKKPGLKRARRAPQWSKR